MWQEDVHCFVHVYSNSDSSFTQMMQRYGMGGARTETSPQEVSQSLQSAVVMVWANKVKDIGVNHGPRHYISFSLASPDKSNHFLLPSAIHFLLYTSKRTEGERDTSEDCSDQIEACA